jgi:hypothetical protein
MEKVGDGGGNGDGNTKAEQEQANYGESLSQTIQLGTPPSRSITLIEISILSLSQQCCRVYGVIPPFTPAALPYRKQGQN